MNRPLLPVFAAVVNLSLLLGSGPALAKVDPRTSHADPLIVGDPAGTRAYLVNVRDINGAPQNRRLVTLDFSGSVVRLYEVQEPGTTLNCAARTLSRVTDASGNALFHPQFGSACNTRDVLVFADGIVITAACARSTDMDAVDGCTGLGDLVRFAPCLLDRSGSHPEADFDGSGGVIGLGDLAIFAGDLLSGAKGSYCP